MKNVTFKFIFILICLTILTQIGCQVEREKNSNITSPSPTAEKSSTPIETPSAIINDSPAPPPSPESSANGKKLIGLVDNSEFKYLDGCGCSLSSIEDLKRNQFYLLRETYNKTKTKKVWMNIDGETIELDLVNTTRPKEEKNGVEFVENYKKDAISVKVDYIVKQENLIGGEVTNYSATITATKNGRTETVKTGGDCGC